MIHLALDGLPDWTAGAELQHFAYVHLAPSLDADGADLPAGDRRAAARRAGAGGRPADGDRPVARAGGQACALGAGARAARRDPRAMRPARSRRPHWDEVKERYADRVLDDDRGATRRACAAKILGRAVVLAPRPRARESRTSSAATRSAAATTSRRTSCSARRAAMPDGNTPVAEPASDRRGDMAGRRRRRRLRLLLAQQLAGSMSRDAATEPRIGQQRTVT